MTPKSSEFEKGVNELGSVWGQVVDRYIERSAMIWKQPAELINVTAAGQ
jgi:hypothetical protein